MVLSVAMCISSMKSGLLSIGELSSVGSLSTVSRENGGALVDGLCAICVLYWGRKNRWQGGVGGYVTGGGVIVGKVEAASLL